MSAATDVRAWVRLSAVILVMCALLLGLAAPADAHPTLLFTDPGPNTAVPESPRAISLVFSEPVAAGPNGVTVFDDDDQPMPVGQVDTAKGGRVVVAAPTRPLPPGGYVVRWRITGSDGDAMEQDFRFAVGTAISGGPAAAGDQPIAWPESALRWLLFAGLALALGGLVGERWTASARAENSTLRRLLAPVLLGTGIGLLGVVGLATLVVFDTGTVGALWQDRIGRLLAAEAAGFVLAMGVAAVGRERHRLLAAAPLLVVAAAEGLRSHANASAPGWGALLTGLHVAAVAVWVGGLLHVARTAVAWRGQRAAVRWVLLGYARIAWWIFLVVVGTGTVTAMLLVPFSTLTTTTYGVVLLIKLGLVAVAAGLAVAARRRLVRSGQPVAASALARVEAGVLIAVLAVSAVLVSTPQAGSQATAPAPARGLVLPLGALAGQVGIGAAASEGQLVVRMTTPLRGDYYETQEQQRYTLSGQLDAGSANDAPLKFSGCGKGCFVASADWQPGDNVVTLRADAEGWRGGAVSLLAPWPATSGADELKRAVAAMREAKRVTMYETVTSDTSVSRPDPRLVELSSADFLSLAPYGSGIAPVAARISGPGELIRLALGFPAAAINVRFTLDERGRISEETLTDAKHLIHRRFVYQD